ncbi:Alanine--tRNA ligase [Orbilia ellipsospora]|uniref:Alanine--tRNA ligase n=1 Tax=Orbilia ellipsospora TaxID=2528407 RepID=A0AAV9XGH9_9PEZI
MSVPLARCCRRPLYFSLLHNNQHRTLQLSLSPSPSGFNCPLLVVFGGACRRLTLSSTSAATQTTQTGQQQQPPLPVAAAAAATTTTTSSNYLQTHIAPPTHLHFTPPSTPPSSTSNLLQRASFLPSYQSSTVVDCNCCFAQRHHGSRVRSPSPIPVIFAGSFIPAPLNKPYRRVRNITLLSSNSRSTLSKLFPPATFLLNRRLTTMSSSSSVTAPKSNLQPKDEIEWTATKVRDTFLEFFKKKSHDFVKSSSCIPHDDKTLLFANAGMNQFKPIFLGTVDPNSSMGKLKRATNTQKCIRAGGKHNDLEDVGKDSYHHTFFEMLGNWSFGDYFKKEAVDFSWELLTQVFKLDSGRLYVTYFGGDEASGLPADLETRDLWLKIGVKEDHVLPGNLKDNFWEMGDQGPCGPCTEIHYDRIGGGRNAAHLVNMDDPNVLEIWNNVFIQFNREADKSLKPLPRKHVDTGMGFERLVSILQDKPSNYDTDVFTPLFAKIQEISGMRPYGGKFGKDDKDQIDTAYRVIADHLRTLAFGLADGGRPDNEGRGYVLRRIIRRGARYARRKMGVEIGSFFSKLLPTLIDQMSPVFPELKTNEKHIIHFLDDEEKAFAKTLDKGEKLFEGLAQEALSGKKILSGLDVWKLYDTFGFPLDLTRIMAEELDLKIDEQGLKDAEKEAKERSKMKKMIGGKEAPTLDVHNLAILTEEGVPRTNDEYKFKWGKDADIKGAKILKVLVNKEFVPSTEGFPADEQIGIILDKTCLYAEQGGQIYDYGSISIPGKADLPINYVQAFRGWILHVGTIKAGVLKPGDIVNVEYDEERRAPIRVNHTATHILNFALRDVLGDHVNQKGSLVDPDKTRFDFTNDGVVDVKALAKIEKISNDYIYQNLVVYAADIDLKDAEHIEGVRAVFGEKYPDPVRVVAIGYGLDEIMKDPGNKDWRKLSVEFCGGTHLKTTGDIKDLVITEESGTGKGIRRIVAVTDKKAATIRELEKKYHDRITELDNMDEGSAQELAGKTIGSELNVASVSSVGRARLKEELSVVTKKIAEKAKARAKVELKKAEDSIKGAFASSKKNSAVITLDAGTSMKTVSECLKLMQKSFKDKAVYLIVKPETSDPEPKVLHACHLPDPVVSQGTTATHFTEQISNIVKGGASKSRDGRTSQGSGTDHTRYDDALHHVTKLFDSLNF